MPLLAASALAAGIPADVGGGHALVRVWCTSCHAVEPGDLEGPMPDVLSFTAVAQLPYSRVVPHQLAEPSCCDFCRFAFI
jgi:hypothetical protein